MTELTDEQWRAKLTPEEYHVLRESGTEPAFSGEYTDLEDEGIYTCRGCSAELFRSTEKFHSGCGWPSFWKPAESESVRLLDDFTGGRHRIEVRCKACDGHLGHVFDGENFGNPIDQRWCINSISVSFTPRPLH
jgi:peptide-methionine (R)-S-oxide reductase